MTSRQLTGWMAYAELEPFGPLAEEHRAGVVAAAAYNTAFGRSKGSKVIKPEDLFSSLRKPTKRQTANQMAEQLRGLTKSMGGVVRKKGDPVPKGEVKPVKKPVKKLESEKPEPKSKRAAKG